MVTWRKPNEGTYKLNTYGSALQESGKIGGGGIVRDHQGNLINAFSLPFGLGTNNITEIKAALYGLDWYEPHGYRSIEFGSRLRNVVQMDKQYSSNTLEISKDNPTNSRH
ncbi:uncharacterized protein [Solanum lycopersicum]|uniref:uncharacterized protein n=1 Tax=Solanum lycopersicum TaxID=4081 RepID=UPI000532DDA1|nr:uncharacterized protein LOC104644614 [Solanum lycopersicum]